MEIQLIQIIAIVVVIIIFGVAITIVNLKKKETPSEKEQSIWQNIEILNSKKKEILDKKKEITYKYTAKTINDEEYSNELKKINEEINKIELQIDQEINKLSKEQTTVESDLRFTNIKLKGELSEIKMENKNLKEKIKELEEYIKNISKNTNTIVENNDTYLKKYYEIILNKYKEEINQSEKKTISEIKNMIRPTDLTIKSITTKFTPIGYDFNKDYLNSARQIYNYLKSEINIIKNDLKILFWIEYATIITKKIADEQDIAIFYCSCLQALGDQNAKVEIILLENEKIHAIVKTKYKNTHYIFDLTQKVPFDMFKNTDEKKLYEEYAFNNSKIAKRIYAYNQNEYIDYRSE